MQDYILEVENISKEFPGVKALSNVSFKVRKGDVHALVGENGAGKSTLMKILNGNYKKDSGRIIIDGKEVNITNPNEAKMYGISIIFQELNLVDLLSIAENIYIGRLPKKNGIIDWKTLYKNTSEVLKKVGYDIDPRTKIGTLSVAQKQMIEIARALSYDTTRIILMDEPTATLTTQETDLLFDVVRKLKADGVSVIFISHKLEELFEICDMLTVIRDGQVIETMPIEGLTKDDVTAKMIGREITNIYPKRNKCVKDEVVLKVENFSHKEVYKNINFELRKGEVLGVAGLVGAGRTEIARGIFGIDYIDQGELRINGKKVKIKEPADCIKNGICYLSEDRKSEGLMGKMDIRYNISAADMAKFVKKVFLDEKLERKNANELVERLRVKTPSLEEVVFNLSGGNMQKVVLAKWLNTNVDIFIFDEPTRGIDVGAKYEIYQLINELVERGKSVIMISSELPEVMGMSDRVMIVRRGEISAILDIDTMTPNDFIKYAI